MQELAYNNNDYPGLLQVLARFFNAQVDNNFMKVSAKLGDGYVSAYNLPDGISVLISDTCFHETIVMQRHASTNQHYYILQFNEALGAEFAQVHDMSDEHYTYYVDRQPILLTSSLMNSKFIFPANQRIRSVRIILGSDLFSNYAGNETADKLLTSYFSMLLKNRHPEIIDTGYRAIMDELIRERFEHPLQLKFIYNRVMLLIEKFVTGFMEKLENNNQFFRLKDDEISRLIKVEALLVKDYSGTPPVIAALSKVAAMSPTKLKRDFKSMYGLPIYEYYQKNRMLRAKALLMEGKYAIKEVGIMVGYSNLGHFAGSFKKEFGVLPSEVTV